MDIYKFVYLIVCIYRFFSKCLTFISFVLIYLSICYLPIGLNFIHDENKADYSKLINHKLMFDDMSKLTTFINSGWKDLNRWWNSPQTNQVRNEFCLKYSIHPPKNAIKKFSYVLTRNINQKN